MSFSREEYKATSLDWRGQRVGRRRFYVDIRDPGGAQDYVRINNGLATDGAFPGFSTCLCDVVQDEPANDGVGTLVTGTYSTDRRFGSWQNVNKDNAGYFSFDVTCRSVMLDTPVNTRTTVTDRTTGTTTDVWTIVGHKIEEGRIFINVNVTADSWDASKTSAVLAQVNHIHHIGTYYYQFKGGRTRQRTQATDKAPAKYDVTYEWFGDNGSAKIVSADTTKFQYCTFDRPSFSKYIVRPSSNAQTTPHEILTYNPYKNDFLGYLNLPNCPPL